MCRDKNFGVTFMVHGIRALWFSLQYRTPRRFGTQYLCAQGEITHRHPCWLLLATRTHCYWIVSVQNVIVIPGNCSFCLDIDSLFTLIVITFLYTAFLYFVPQVIRIDFDWIHLWTRNIKKPKTTLKNTPS